MALSSTKAQPSPANNNQGRRTTTRTFRIYRDQLEYLDAVFSDDSSFFIRSLLDYWTGNKIPLSARSEIIAAVKKYKSEVAKNH